MCPHQHPTSPTGEKGYYREKLRETLLSRKVANPSYSLRSFARSLGLHAASLSSVLNGKRPLPTAHLERILAQLNLEPQERVLFVESVRGDHPADGFSTPPRHPGALVTENAHFQLITEWEHGAILCLMETRGFRPYPAWIARRLGLSLERATRCVENLLEHGILKRTATGSLRKSRKSFRTSDEVKSVAVRRFHRSALQLAERKLEQIPLELRDFTAMAVAFNPDKLGRVKTRIRRFYRELDRLVADQDAREVYQISIQLFPLTTIAAEASAPEKEPVS